MKSVFLDANALLRFYDTRRPQLQKLLPALEDNSAHLIITEQVACEVRRNRLKVTSATLKLPIKRSDDTPQGLPDHLSVSSSSSAKNFNSKLDARVREGGKLKEEHRDAVSEILSLVSTGKDSVSIVLEKLFEGALIADESQLDRAEVRMKRGNPPGKGGLPIGDELSWEQILDGYDGLRELILITNDSDYCVKYDGELYLNSHLYHELQRKCPPGQSPRLKIHASIEDAASALRSLPKFVVTHLPSSTEIQRIKEERATFSPWIGLSAEPPYLCPNCKTAGHFDNGGALRSRFGGLTIQYRCRNCGFLLDSGEPWD